MIMYKMERSKGEFIIFATLGDLYEEIGDNLEANSGLAPVTMTFEVEMIEMSQEEFDALPKDEDY